MIVDEFHHASAPTYQRFLDYFKPKILLGLTATPERMDGASILDYFDNRIAAEIRLPEAIDRKLFSPFQYFGVTDTVDLSDLKWERGGYEKSELTNLYSLNREVAVKRANHIIESLDNYELKHGFVSAPKGCYVQFEKKAQEYILDNIRASYSGKRGLISRIESFEEDTGKGLTFANFISHYHMDAREIYGKFSFARLKVWAGVREDFNEPAEEVLTKAFSRIVAIDSRRWIEFLLGVLPRLMEVRFAELPEVQLRMMRMFYITVWQKYMADFDNEEAFQNLKDLSDSPVMLAELIDLLQYRYDQIDLVDEPMDIGFDCPLDVHCTYTARQILTAFDDEKVMSFRESVKWLPAKNTDVFFITLNKSDKDYSPTTMYNDYSINEILFHWQSQSTTSDNSPTGQRYIHLVLCQDLAQIKMR